MKVMDYNDMSETQIDILKEIGNIGVGNATTALSTMLGRRIDISVPAVKMVPIPNIADIIGGPEETVVGILLTLEGDINGMMMFVMNEKSAKSLINMVLNGADLKEDKESDTRGLKEMEKSALKELGNIITGAYMTAISQMTGFTINESVPHLAFDMAGAVMSVPAIEFGKLGDKAMMIEASFAETTDDVDGYYLMIPDEESYIRMMNKLMAF